MRTQINDKVRIRSGNTVDSARCHGGDLKGLKAVVISEPEISAPDGPDAPGEKEERVAVAIYDENRPPASPSIVTIPTRRLEPQSRVERIKTWARGIAFGPDGSIAR